MDELKALVVVLGLSLPVFWIARAPATAVAVDPADFARRRNLWIAITLLAFLSHSFWIYIVGAALLTVFTAQREPNRLALFLAVMLAIPTFAEVIPGFGGIQQIISISHVRMLSMVVLLPAYVAIRRQPGVLPFGRTMADRCLFGYLALQLLLQMSAASFTGIARYAIYSVTDVFLPYYVASRGLRDLRAFRDVVMTLVLAVVVMAPVAVFEYFRHWLLYSGLSASMGIFDKMGAYMDRGGNLRAVVTASHSIVLGYLATVALGLFVFARRFIAGRGISGLALAMLLVTLVASGARGPWVGSAAVLAMVVLTGPDKFKRGIRILLIAVPILAALSFTEQGRRLFDVLPFIGTVDTDSIDYRQQLFDTSMRVIAQNPWFGAFDYLVNPAMQDLITGDGIIDVVNSFLGVALTFGVVGLSLFAGVFVFSGWGVWAALRRADPRDESSLLGRALLATLIGVMVTIVTVSSISVVPWVYWMLAGLCVGYPQLVPEASPAAASVAPARGVHLRA